MKPNDPKTIFKVKLKKASDNAWFIRLLIFMFMAFGFMYYIEGLLEK